MPADILAPNADPVLLAIPLPETSGPNSYAYTQTGFAVMGDNPDEVVVASQNSQDVVLTGYSLNGGVLFQDKLVVDNAVGYATSNPSLATVPGGGVAVAWQQADYMVHGSPHVVDVTAVLADGGALTSQTSLDGQNDLAPTVFSSTSGYHVEWVQTQDAYDMPVTLKQQDFSATGRAAGPADAVSSWGLKAYADIAIGGSDFSIMDNQAQLAGHAAVTIPGEPSHAMTEAAAVALTDGTSAAVAWADSGTDYVAVFNASTNSFGAVSGLDWGGASDLHLTALADGGFAVSWENGGAYKGEVFDSAGNGGGILPLSGQVAGLDSQGDLYTVGLNASGAEVVQTYAVTAGGSGSGGGSSGGSSSGESSSGSSGASGNGQIFTSDNNGDNWVGTAGDDTFHLGRGGDTVTGGAGADTFSYAETPWAGGHITDFNAGEGDKIDVSGLLARSAYAGSDPFADGYLQLTVASDGSAQLWSDIHQAGNDGWWLVATLDGVSTSSLHYSGGMIT